MLFHPDMECLENLYFLLLFCCFDIVVFSVRLFRNSVFSCLNSVSHNRVQVLSIPVLLLACSQNWTCNLQMIVFLEAEGTNAYNRYAYNRFLWFFPMLIFGYSFSSSLLNYRFPYCIHLCTWSTQQGIVAQHMYWFLKVSNPPMFSPINYINFIP